MNKKEMNKMSESGIFGIPGTFGSEEKKGEIKEEK